MSKTVWEAPGDKPNDPMDSYEIRTGVLGVYNGETGIEIDGTAYECMTGGVFHTYLGDFKLAAGLFGEDGERRVGVSADAALMGFDFDFSELLGEGWILKSNLKTMGLMCNVSAGEDGANFDVGLYSFYTDITFGKSDPDSNHDGQVSVGFAGPGVGIPMPPLIPIPTALHWGDADKDGYREFGAKFVMNLNIGGVSLGCLVIDFRFEIGISDKDFTEFAYAVRDTFVKLGFDMEDDFKKLGKDIEEFGKDVKDEFEDFGDDVKDTFTTFGFNVKDEFTEFGVDAKDAFEDFGKDAKNAFEDFGKDVKDAFEDVGKSIGRALKNLFRI